MRLSEVEEVQLRIVQQVRQLEEEGQITIIRGDAEGAFQNVASVLSACRRAGVSDMGVSVRMARKED